MKKFTKSFITIFVSLIMLISVLPMSAFAANNSTDYWNHNQPTTTLSVGSKGDTVSWLQCALNYLIIKGDSYGHKLNTSKLDVDGAFGEKTQKAVIAFQRKYSIDADGIFGKESRTVMRNALPITNALYAYNNYNVPTTTLKKGSSGSSVRWLQCAINKLIFFGSRDGRYISNHYLEVDGKYGAKTVAAVKAFQKRFGLKDVDGIFGPKSLAKMKSVL
ncbi:peptidoglycan-binding protein [Ruminococcus sp.]|uniref:peptidoglycan-binding domain-containing protein n=1 Tax=Ruminococcus sp. TaxID=41978 RepID=UPI0025D91D4A|nr:peptidoglycan-binding protein [Ruminococcus sp.]